MNINLKEHTLSLLQSGKKLAASWSCGGDEAHIKMSMDGEELPHTDSFAEEMSMYLLNRLSLPDAGEFSMEGDGNFILEKGQIYIDCESWNLGHEDYEKDKWVETEDLDREYSGRFELFKEEGKKSNGRLF
ncbi:MAG: hypothetical protein AB8F95_11030 [Bacteroidia bacterium]